MLPTMGFIGVMLADERGERRFKKVEVKPAF
jgi:hypothetical protein